MAPDPTDMTRHRARAPVVRVAIIIRPARCRGTGPLRADARRVAPSARPRVIVVPCRRPAAGNPHSTKITRGRAGRGVG